MKKALLKQKRNILEALRTTEGQWTKEAWLMERKFEEWNLKRKVEQDTTLRGDPAQKLIEAVLGEPQSEDHRPDQAEEE